MLFAGIIKKLSCEAGIFTLDALVALTLLTLTTTTLAFSLHTAKMHTATAVHREVALQLAQQFTEASKLNPQPTSSVSKIVNGVTYEIVVTSQAPIMDSGNGSRVINLQTKVMWLEHDGKQKQVEMDGLDVLAQVPSSV